MATDYLIIQCLERIKSRIAENIRTSGEWASGKTAGTMRIEAYDGGGTLYGRPGFENLEDGSGPTPPRRYPYDFKDIIADWMEAKGIAPSDDKDKNRMAGNIAWFIRRHGTRLHREGGRDDIYSNVIAEEVEKLKKALAVQVVETISKQLKNN